MTTTNSTMRQTAIFPNELQDIVRNLHYRPGWKFRLADLVRDPEDTHGAVGAGLTFVVTTLGYDSYHLERADYRVNHYFIVPAATYNRQSWVRWVFDCLVKVETHEAMEFFRIEEDEDYEVRPYAPNHGPGHDPYIVREVTTEQDRRTSFRGELNDD